VSRVLVTSYHHDSNSIASDTTLILTLTLQTEYLGYHMKGTTIYSNKEHKTQTSKFITKRISDLVSPFSCTWNVKYSAQFTGPIITDNQRLNWYDRNGITEWQQFNSKNKQIICNKLPSLCTIYYKISNTVCCQNVHSTVGDTPTHITYLVFV